MLLRPNTTADRVVHVFTNSNKYIFEKLVCFTHSLVFLTEAGIYHPVERPAVVKKRDRETEGERERERGKKKPTTKP